MTEAIPVFNTIEATTPDGTRILCDVYPGASDDLALIVPGFWRERRHPSMVDFARSIRESGRTVAVIDIRGHGDSGGVYGFNWKEHQDVQAAVEAIAATRPINAIDVIGLSMGGAIAISTIVRTPHLPWRSALLISSVAEFDTIRPRINLLTLHRHIAFGQALRRPRFDWNFRKSHKLRAVDEVARIGVPLCLIHVKDDWLIGHKHSELLFDRAVEPKEVHILDVPGSFHADRILTAAEHDVRRIITEFLARQKNQAATSRG